MISPLIHVIKLRQGELAMSLAQGNASTWDSYQRMVGEHQGLQYVLDAVNRMLDEERNQE
jgi:hypothetical protein